MAKTQRKALSALAPLFVTALGLGACNKNQEKIALPSETPAAATSTTSGNEAAPASAPASNAPAESSAAAPAAAPAAEETSTSPVEVSKPSTGTESSTGTSQSERQATRLAGEVAPMRKANIAFRVAGFIDTEKARPGMAAKKGEVLATLEARDFEIRLELAKARKEQARVAAETARKDYDREKQLQKENASTPTAYDRAQSAYDNARLALKLADLDLVTAQRALDDTRLEAPYDCVVAAVVKDEKEYVAVGAPVLEIYDTAEPELEFQAPERLYGKLTVGSEVAVSVPSANYSGRAKIIRFVPVISEKTRTFRVFAKLTEGNRSLPPGSYAEARID